MINYRNSKQRNFALRQKSAVVFFCMAHADSVENEQKLLWK